MKQLSGEMKLYGTVCYVPQEAWLLNMTFKENIVFGSDFNPTHYQKTINVCALEQDIKLMADGDKTEIGERGVNLSGGQRQRICLARAIYKYSDIILLDDPISAVDQHVGKHIFEKCLTGYLKEKTVIFITHQLQYLNQVDHILVIKKNQIIEQGSYDELMTLKGHLYSLVGDDSDKLDDQMQEEDEILIENQNENSSNDDVKNNPIIRVAQETNLTKEQKLHRDKLLNKTHIAPTERNIVKIIESHQTTLMGDDAYSMKKAIISNFKHNRVSFVSDMLAKSEMVDLGEKEKTVETGDSAPMKLVLDDQSLTYKENPLWSYIKSNPGPVITLIIIVYFFLVHLIRLLSGK